MAMAGHDDGAWFAPRRFGYGAGLPTAWQGWALLGAYLALVIGVPMWRPHWAPFVAVAATVAIVWIAYAKTRGGWRWRGWR